MKKITFLGALFIAATSFSQVTALESTNGEYPSISTATPRESQAPCSQQEDSNAFENGLGDTNATIEVADDIVVADGEMFTLERITFNMITLGTYADVTVRVYDHDGLDFPMTQLLEEVIVPTSITDIGDAFGRDVLEVVVDLPTPIVLEGQTGSDTTYWISIFTPNGDGADSFWETSTISPSALQIATKLGDDPAGAWSNNGFTNPTAAVFLAEGECDPLLSVGEEALSQISVFPNPMNDVLNVRVPSNVTIESASIFDILGKENRVQVTNGKINVQNLSQGVYILNLRTSAGTLTQKVVKR